MYERAAGTLREPLGSRPGTTFRAILCGQSYDYLSDISVYTYQCCFFPITLNSVRWQDAEIYNGFWIHLARVTSRLYGRFPRHGSILMATVTVCVLLEDAVFVLITP